MLKALAICVRRSVVEFSSSFRAILFLAMLLPGTASFAIEEGDDSTPKQPVFSATIESETSAKVDGSDPSDLYVRLIDLYSTLSAPEKALFDDGDMLPYDGLQVTYESELTFVSEQMAPPSGQETVATPAPSASAQAPYSVIMELDLLKQRIKELEESRVVHEDATRTIIQNSLSARGSYITDAVLFGGTLEVLSGWAEEFDGTTASDVVLGTAQLDFEVLVNKWALGSMIFEYIDGGDFGLLSAAGDEVFVDRINVDTAFVTVGNTQLHPVYTTLGRIVVPFGISTGDPVADALTINDPLTIEVFETREVAWFIGFEYPNYCPPPPPTTPPRKYLTPRPLLLSPLVNKIARRMPYHCPCPTKPKVPATFTRTSLRIPPLSGGIYFYNGNTPDFNFGNTLDRVDDHIDQMGGTLGYRTQGCTPFRNMPWSLDIDVDVTTSVFDSDFLQFEYRGFLPQIGSVTGMAAHLKGNIGPTSWILEWNGAVDDAVFQDDLSQNHTLRPEAWQVQFAYQFDWNPAVEIIGLQGTYFVLGYSESQDLGGVTRDIGGDLRRLGFVPRKRFLVGMGEWVLDGLRVSVEYSHAVDYDVAGGGTGKTADGFFMLLTYEW